MATGPVDFTVAIDAIHEATVAFEVDAHGKCVDNDANQLAAALIPRLDVDGHAAGRVDRDANAARVEAAQGASGGRNGGGWKKGAGWEDLIFCNMNIERNIVGESATNEPLDIPGSKVLGAAVVGTRGAAVVGAASDALAVGVGLLLAPTVGVGSAPTRNVPMTSTSKSAWRNRDMARLGALPRSNESGFFFFF